MAASIRPVPSRNRPVVPHGAVSLFRRVEDETPLSASVPSVKRRFGIGTPYTNRTDRVYNCPPPAGLVMVQRSDTKVVIQARVFPPLLWLMPAKGTGARCRIPPSPLKGVGFFAACLLAELPSRAFLLPCERDARAPNTRYAGNAGVPPAIPTAQEKTYPFKHSRTLSPLSKGGEGWGEGGFTPRHRLSRSHARLKGSCHRGKSPRTLTCRSPHAQPASGILLTSDGSD